MKPSGNKISSPGGGEEFLTQFFTMRINIISNDNIDYLLRLLSFTVAKIKLRPIYSGWGLRGLFFAAFDRFRDNPNHVFVPSNTYSGGAITRQSGLGTPRHPETQGTPEGGGLFGLGQKTTS